VYRCAPNHTLLSFLDPPIFSQGIQVKLMIYVIFHLDRFQYLVYHWSGSNSWCNTDQCYTVTLEIQVEKQQFTVFVDGSFTIVDVPTFRSMIQMNMKVSSRVTWFGYTESKSNFFFGLSKWESVLVSFLHNCLFVVVKQNQSSCGKMNFTTTWSLQPP
jgi:hypothetical protein